MFVFFSVVVVVVVVVVMLLVILPVSLCFDESVFDGVLDVVLLKTTVSVPIDIVILNSGHNGS